MTTAIFSATPSLYARIFPAFRDDSLTRPPLWFAVALSVSFMAPVYALLIAAVMVW